MSERNKQTVLDFYEAGLNQKDFDAAAKLIGDRYLQPIPDSVANSNGMF